MAHQLSTCTRLFANACASIGLLPLAVFCPEAARRSALSASKAVLEANRPPKSSQRPKRSKTAPSEPLKPELDQELADIISVLVNLGVGKTQAKVTARGSNGHGNFDERLRWSISRSIQ